MSKFLFGLIFGVGIAGVVAYYLNNMPNQFVIKSSNQSNNSSTNSAEPIVLAPGTKFRSLESASITSKDNASATSYDFYDILEGKKDNAATTDKHDAHAPNTATAGAAANYYVQSGSFTDSNSADNMKAKLALMGIDSVIKSKPDGNTVVNRVVIGPFNSYDAASKVVSQLAHDQIQSNVVKVSD